MTRPDAFFDARDTLRRARERSVQHSGTPDGAVQSCRNQSDIRVVEIVEVLPDDSTVVIEGDRQTQTRRQYVNLIRDREGRGRFVRFKARIERVDGNASPLDGYSVYWRFEPEESDRQDLSDRYYPNLPNSMKAGFNSGGWPASTTQERTDDEGWTDEVDFYLSKYGGDDFTIWASNQEDSGGMSAGTYRVWRKVFFQIDYMARPNDRGVCGSRTTGSSNFGDDLDLQVMKEKFADMFVEFQEISSGVPPNDPRLAHERTLRTLGLGGWGRDIRGEDSRLRARRDRFIQLALVDSIITGEESPTDYTFCLTSAGDTATRNDVSLTFPDSVLLDASWPQPPGSWYITSWIRQQSGGVRQAWREVTSPGGRFRLEWDQPAGCFKIVFNQNGLDGLNLTLSTYVDFKFRVRRVTNLAGFQTIGPIAVCGRRWIEARGFSPHQQRDLSMNNICHEIAHALGLAARNYPNNVRNPNSYLRNGWHCHNNSDTCVMYQRASTHTDFCDDCTKAIKARDLSSLAVGGYFRFR